MKLVNFGVSWERDQPAMFGNYVVGPDLGVEFAGTVRRGIRTFFTVPEAMKDPPVARESTQTTTPPWYTKAHVVVPGEEKEDQRCAPCVEDIFISSSDIRWNI